MLSESDWAWISAFKCLEQTRHMGVYIDFQQSSK
jgi:hypothetical protein